MATKSASPKESKTDSSSIKIAAPNFRTAEITICGNAPLMMARFSKKAQIMAKHELGQAAKNKKTRTARDFSAEAKEAAHISREGWYGIPASAFRSACIRACSTVGAKMTIAKMSVFVLADGISRDEGTPLVRLIAGKPEESVMHVRNATGVCDLRARPIWREWSAKVRVRWDNDQFTLEDVVNLMARAGIQVGVLEGRPFSKSSDGMGFGTWDVLEVAELGKVKEAAA